MEVVLIYDMRAPDFGAPRSEIFATALEMAEWGDSVGIDIIGFGEHHNSDDGYNPSPLIMASAVAARTRRVRLRSAVLLASCYDPISRHCAYVAASIDATREFNGHSSTGRGPFRFHTPDMQIRS